jgi:hypothetical protein
MLGDQAARRDAGYEHPAGGLVIGLLVVVFGVRFVLDDPTYLGATFLLVLPTALVEHLRVGAGGVRAGGR